MRACSLFALSAAATTSSTLHKFQIFAGQKGSGRWRRKQLREAKRREKTKGARPEPEVDDSRTQKDIDS